MANHQASDQKCSRGKTHFKCQHETNHTIQKTNKNRKKDTILLYLSRTLYSHSQLTSSRNLSLSSPTWIFQPWKTNYISRLCNELQFQSKKWTLVYHRMKEWSNYDNMIWIQLPFQEIIIIAHPSFTFKSLPVLMATTDLLPDKHDLTGLFPSMFQFVYNRADISYLGITNILQ